jgi:DNA-binding FadR family transcriptional regulator
MEFDVPRARDPFHQALESLRMRAMRGVYGSGGPVVIIDEARRLGLSTTPVREALACLCGEGLLERAPRAGYLSPRLDAALLRDRYWVRLRTLTTSLELTMDRAGPAASDGEAGGEVAVQALFDRLVRETGNRALVETFRRVDAPLRMLGGAEARVFADSDEEAAALARIGAAGSRIQLATAIERYHRRRIDSAALLVLDVERRGPRPEDED